MEPRKRDTLADFLTRGVTMIVLDARQPGVIVPENLRDADLRLKISYRFDPLDLELTDRGISCTLSFNRRRSYVFVPWAALWAATDGNAIAQWEPPAEPPALTKRRGGLGLVS